MKKIYFVFISIFLVFIAITTTLYYKYKSFDLSSLDDELPSTIRNIQENFETASLKTTIKVIEKSRYSINDNISLIVPAGTNIKLEVDYKNNNTEIAPTLLNINSNKNIIFKYKKTPVLKFTNFSIEDNNFKLNTNANLALSKILNSIIFESARNEENKFTEITIHSLDIYLKKDKKIDLFKNLQIKTNLNNNYLSIKDMFIKNGKINSGNFTFLANLSNFNYNNEINLTNKKGLSINLFGHISDVANNISSLSIDDGSISIDSGKLNLKKENLNSDIKNLKFNLKGSALIDKDFAFQNGEIDIILNGSLENFNVINNKNNISAENINFIDLKEKLSFYTKNETLFSELAIADKQKIELQGLNFIKKLDKFTLELNSLDLTLLSDKINEINKLKWELSNLITEAQKIKLILSDKNWISINKFKGEFKGLPSSFSLNENIDNLDLSKLNIKGSAKSLEFNSKEKRKIAFPDIELISNINIADNEAFTVQTNIKVDNNNSIEIKDNSKTVNINNFNFNFNSLDILFTQEELKVYLNSLKFFIPKSLLYGKIREAIPERIEEHYEDLSGRDFGRLISLGTVDDYRLRWSADKIKLSKINFANNSADLTISGKVNTVLEGEIIATKTGYKTVDVPKLKFKDRVPQFYSEKKKVPYPIFSHKWRDTAKTTIGIDISSTLDIEFPKNTFLNDAILKGELKLKSFDIKNFPAWLEKELLTPMITKLKPRLKSVSLEMSDLIKSDSNSDKEFTDRIWINSMSLYPEGNNIILDLSCEYTEIK